MEKHLAGFILTEYEFHSSPHIGLSSVHHHCHHNQHSPQLDTFKHIPVKTGKYKEKLETLCPGSSIKKITPLSVMIKKHTVTGLAMLKGITWTCFQKDHVYLWYFGTTIYLKGCDLFKSFN